MCIYSKPVSYTHLDVYKRQLLSPSKFSEAADKLLTKTKNLNYAGFALDTLSSAAYSDYSDKTKSAFYAKNGVGDVVARCV